MKTDENNKITDYFKIENNDMDLDQSFIYY